MQNALTDDRDAISAAWVAIVAVATIASTLVFACAMPFEALAAFAALHFSRRAGLVLVALCWTANQAIGFAVLGYPVDGSTIAWGAGLASAAVAALLAAGRAADALAAFRFRPVPRIVLTLAAAFVAFKAVVLVWALILGGVETTLSPYWSARQVALDGAFLIGFLGVRAALIRLGMPASGKAQTAR